MDIIKVLVKERKSKGIKQKQIADFIGISGSLMSRLESGTIHPNLNYVVQFADYLGYELRLLKNK